MNQLSLNLVAITIFIFVLASLLGPWLHLSPTIPAIAVFGLLSFATLDTLSWQGRGSALVLDWIAHFSPEHRTRILRHEAGHFWVAQHLGIPVIGYTLSAWEAFREGQPGLGGVRFDTQELDAELEKGVLSAQLIDRYCIVWMAGIAAETLSYGNAAGGIDDCQKLRILWMQLKRPLAECDTKERWAILQAKHLIQTNQSAYEALVTVMGERASLDQCYQAIAMEKN
jgi:hypothetical protein